MRRIRVTLSWLSKSLLAAALSVPAVFAAPDPNFHIYLMIGQSNMAGAGTIEAQDRPAHPKVEVMQDITCAAIGVSYGEWRPATPPLIWCPGGTDGLGPGDYFGKGMGDAAAAPVTIGLVGAAYPGAAIEYFLKDCAARNSCTPPFGGVAGAPNNGNSGGYLWIMDLARKAQERGVIKGIIFHQGESNTGNKAQWPGLVNQLVTDIRNDLGLVAEDTPFIAAELVCCGMNDAVREIPNVVSNGHYVSATGLTRKDDYHMDSASNREIGRRFAAKMLEVANTEPESCGVDNGTPVCCSILDDDNGDGVGELASGEMCVVTPDSGGWHPGNPSDVIAAINVGGEGDSIEYDGIWYEPDHFFSGGLRNNTSDPIANSEASALFQTERYGSFHYQIPVANGSYSVVLGMVEMYQTNPGTRAFDVELEAQRVVQNLDLYQQAGHDVAVVKGPFATRVSDGKLDIEVTGLVDNGTLSSILVRKASSSSSSSSSASSSSSSSASSSSASSSSSSSSNSGSSSGDAGSSTSAGALDLMLALVLALSFPAFGLRRRRHLRIR